MNWLERHGKALQAASSVLTVLLALAALIGVKYQVDASARQQRDQSARDIYRELLNISLANPDLAAPDYCALKSSPKFPAYENYVEYVLYASEQVMEMDPSWRATVATRLQDHAAYLCAADDSDLANYASPVETMVEEFRANSCKSQQPACP